MRRLALTLALLVISSGTLTDQFPGFLGEMVTMGKMEKREKGAPILVRAQSVSGIKVRELQDAAWKSRVRCYRPAG